MPESGAPRAARTTARMRRCGGVFAASLAIATAAALASWPPATAAAYPEKAINLYIGSAPAGSTDVLGRVLAKALEQILGQAVVVQNTPGAGGAVMAMQLLKSAPDGYSLGMTISHAYSGYPIVMPAAANYGVADFTHLASVSKGQCALVTSVHTPYATFADLIEAARHGAQPVFASQSQMTRIVADYIAKVENVHFRIITVQGGGEMMQTILGGHADFGFSGGPHVDHVASGQMRVLASAEDRRLATSPEVPTLQELGYDIASCALFLVSAPPRLPRDVEQTLAAALERAIRSPEMVALIHNLQYPEHYLGPEDVTRALEQESDSLQRALARISGSASADGGGELSPAFMPFLAAALGVLAMAVMILARLSRRTRVESVTAMPRESWHFILAAGTVLAVTFALMEGFGYLAGATAIVAGFMVLARAKRSVVVGTTLFFPILLWLLFDKLLGFPLP